VSPKIKGGLNIEHSLAIIIFVAGNADPTSQNLSYLPIRLAKIVKVHYDDQTDLYHVYFLLDGFIEMDCNIAQLDETPSSTYFGIQVIAPTCKRILWKDLVKKLDQYSNSFFFHVKMLSNLTELRPTYDPTTYESFYDITEGKNYSFRLSISDNNKNKNENELKTSIQGTDIKSNIGDTLYSGLSLDSRNFVLAGLILGDVSSSVNLINVSTFSVDENKAAWDYSVRLLFKVKKDPARRIAYFWLSASILLGGGIIATDLSKYGLSEGIATAVKFLGLFGSALAASNLFYRFNKK
jgi:hypothetical protein